MEQKKRNFSVYMLISTLILAIAASIIWVYVFHINSTSVYHEYFYYIRTYSAGGGYDGRQAVVRPNANSWAVVDIETGREIRRFQNGRHEYQLIYFSADSIIYVRRFGNRNSGSALIDVESGREIIPFGRYSYIGHVFNGMAVVGDNFRLGVVELETGREMIPLYFSRIVPFSDTKARVQLRGELRGADWIEGAWGVIDVTTGEELLPFQYNFVIRGAGSLVSVTNDMGAALIDLESGNYIIPFGTYWWIDISECGLAVVSGDEGRALIDIKSGHELIPFGNEYRSILVKSGDVAVVTRRNYDICPWGTVSSHGIVEIAGGNEVVPIGKYDFWIFGYVDGMFVVYDEGQVAVMEAKSGKLVVPFGVFDDIQLWPGGIIAVQENGIWRFECLEQTACAARTA